MMSTRSARGDLKLCQVPEAVHKVLKITSLTTLFDIHDSEENAVLAFYHRHAAPARVAHTGFTAGIDQLSETRSRLLCASRHGRGYNVLTSNSLRDGMIPVARHPPGSRASGPQPQRSARGRTSLPHRMRRPAPSNWEKDLHPGSGPGCDPASGRNPGAEQLGPVPGLYLTYFQVHFLIRLVWLATHCHLLSW